jgi:hypothetical protein
VAVTAGRKICLQCIGDDALRSRLSDQSRKAACAYCHARRKGVPLEELAEIVDEPLRAYLQRGGSVPRFSADSDSPYFEQEGEELSWVLQEELAIDVEPAEHLADILIENDPADPRDGDEPFFASDQHYERAYLHPWEYLETWERFANRIKHERRFFDSAAQAELAQILGDLGSSKAADLPITVIGPDKPLQQVFRARRVETQEEAKKILLEPALRLGPPPTSSARAGRMNPAGIAVFYGALSELTAIAEVRPPVGGLAVAGSFKPLKPLRLLDLTRMGEGFTGSIFNPEYEDRATRLSFLQGFHSKISRPIQPHEESLEYIPTQAVAEYVANVLQIDGIMYASSQVGTYEDLDGSLSTFSDDPSVCNVVLFGQSGKVVSSANGEPVESGKDGERPPLLAYVQGSARTMRLSYKVDQLYMWDGEIGDAPF